MTQLINCLSDRNHYLPDSVFAFIIALLIIGGVSFFVFIISRIIINTLSNIRYRRRRKQRKEDDEDCEQYKNVTCFEFISERSTHEFIDRINQRYNVLEREPLIGFVEISYIPDNNCFLAILKYEKRIKILE